MGTTSYSCIGCIVGESGDCAVNLSAVAAPFLKMLPGRWMSFGAPCSIPFLGHIPTVTTRMSLIRGACRRLMKIELERSLQELKFTAYGT